MPRIISLAVIAGDGIGPEVIIEALKVLAAAAPADVTVETTQYPFGATHYLATGEILSDEHLVSLASHDAILLGAVGGDPRDARLAGGIIERGLLLKLRFSFDHYVNLRPTVLYPSVTSPLANPGHVDFVVVREGTEGPYVGNGGAIRVGTPNEVANEVSVNTAFGVERLVRYAFEVAQTRRNHLTLVHKTNVLVHAGGLWQRTVNAIASEYPDTIVDYLHIDAATIAMVVDPARFDTIVTDNLFGDIITDLAGAISGGIGLAASGNINPDRTFPSMFEPVHGSAPDIAGQQKADPTAAILSVALLLENLGLQDAAAAVTAAVLSDLTNRAPGSRTTGEVGDAIAAALTAQRQSQPTSTSGDPALVFSNSALVSSDSAPASSATALSSSDTVPASTESRS
ncbi:MAG: 3-isopropylmalate dehydrogenase [Microbacteriaceae bacterium]|nr:3-isopropylmalate dehydrogenase [Microbacteriaceae bacterium]